MLFLVPAPDVDGLLKFFHFAVLLSSFDYYLISHIRTKISLRQTCMQHHERPANKLRGITGQALSSENTNLQTAVGRTCRRCWQGWRAARGHQPPHCCAPRSPPTLILLSQTRQMQTCATSSTYIISITLWLLRRQMLPFLKDPPTHSFSGPLSRTIRVSQYQKGRTNRDFTEARDSLSSAGPYAILHCAPDSHASTPPLSFSTGQMPFLPPNQQRQFCGLSIASVSCHLRWPPPTTTALTTLLGY